MGNIKTEPRPYQTRLAEELVREGNQNYIIWAPLGSGKTLVPLIAFDIKKDADIINENAKMVVIVPYRPLAHQWEQMIMSSEQSGSSFKIFKAIGDEYHTLKHVARRQNEDIDKTYLEMFKNADIIITTPIKFNNTISRLKKGYGREVNKLLSQVNMVVYDECRNLISCSIDPEDAIVGFRPSKPYFDVLELFKTLATKPQTIGLTGVLTDTELIGLERTLEAATIAPPEHEVYSYINKPKEHIIHVDDKDIAEICKRLFKIRNNAVDWLKKNTRADKSNMQFYSLITSVFMSAADCVSMEEVLKGEVDQGEYEWLRRLGIAAKEVLAVDLLNEYLYSAVGFLHFKNVLDGMTKDSSNFLYLEPNDNIKEIYSILDRRIKENPKTLKLEVLEKLLDCEDLYYAGFDMDIDGNVLKPSIVGNQVLVFTRLVESAKNIQRYFSVKGFDMIALTGATVSEETLSPYLSNFREGRIKMVVATDRYLQLGLDVPGTLIVDFDYSSNPSNREQRLARGRGSDTYTLVYKNTSEEVKLKRIAESVSRLKHRVRVV